MTNEAYYDIQFKAALVFATQLTIKEKGYITDQEWADEQATQKVLDRPRHFKPHSSHPI
jgi:hypothetical protein